MTKVTKKLASALAGLALKVTTFNANSTCVCVMHQPKLPPNAQKLRKF